MCVSGNIIAACVITHSSPRSFSIKYTTRFNVAPVLSALFCIDVTLLCCVLYTLQNGGGRMKDLWAHKELGATSEWSYCYLSISEWGR
mmetsp:Transcript_28956/g.74364  ORF Transcript_28956/g.74364 Transcript_28956/m.74364 type:complete len:88 (+) Transcript_28956:507-770(+)